MTTWQPRCCCWCLLLCTSLGIGLSILYKTHNVRFVIKYDSHLRLPYILYNNTCALNIHFVRQRAVNFKCFGLCVRYVLCMPRFWAGSKRVTYFGVRSWCLCRCFDVVGGRFSLISTDDDRDVLWLSFSCPSFPPIMRYNTLAVIYDV